MIIIGISEQDVIKGYKQLNLRDEITYSLLTWVKSMNKPFQIFLNVFTKKSTEKDPSDDTEYEQYILNKLEQQILEIELTIENF